MKTILLLLALLAGCNLAAQPLHTIRVGAVPNDGTGDTLRVMGQKVNSNFVSTVRLDASGTVIGPPAAVFGNCPVRIQPASGVTLSVGSYSGTGIYGTSGYGAGVSGESVAGNAVTGKSGAGYGGYFESADGIALKAHQNGQTTDGDVWAAKIWRDQLAVHNAAPVLFVASSYDYATYQTSSDKGACLLRASDVPPGSTATAPAADFKLERRVTGTLPGAFLTVTDAVNTAGISINGLVIWNNGGMLYVRTLSGVDTAVGGFDPAAYQPASANLTSWAGIAPGNIQEWQAIAPGNVMRLNPAGPPAPQDTVNVIHWIPITWHGSNLFLPAYK